MLALLDAYALRRTGIGDGLQASTYWAVATTAIAGALGAYSTVVPLRLARWSAAVLAQLPVPLLLHSTDPAPSTSAVVLTAQAGADVAVATRAPLPADVRRLVGALGGLFTLFALASCADAVDVGERTAWAGFAALAVLAAAASWQAPTRALRDVCALPVVPLLAAAAWAAARPELTSTQEPLVVIAVALIGLQLVGLLPQDRRDGAAYGALAVALVSLLVEAEPVLQAVFGPFTWLTDPWTLTATSARAALGPDLTWDGTVVTLVVLAGAAGCSAIAGVVLERVRIALTPTAVLLVMSAVTLPLGLATSYRDALLLLLLVAGILAVAGVLVLDRARLIGVSAVAASTATALLACAWSTADQDSTLTVLAVAAALCAGLSLVLPGVLTSVALLLLGGELAAVGAAQGLAVDQVGGLLLAAVAVCPGLSWLLRGYHRLAAETSAGILGIAAIACAASDPGWLSWTLAGVGIAALVIAIHPDRRVVGWVGGLLIAASSWVRLADAHVKAPEPYVLPLAVAVLVAGWFRRRSHPSASSWEVYGGGLALALVPSLLRSFGDETPTRGLALLTAAVVVTLVGARARMQAPLVIGAIVAVVEALVLLAPYANALPRWMLLGGAGLVLVLLGATYEARRRDLTRLRERYDQLS